MPGWLAALVYAVIAALAVCTMPNARSVAKQTGPNFARNSCLPHGLFPLQFFIYRPYISSLNYNLFILPD
jgi:hypothetical protein